MTEAELEAINRRVEEDAQGGAPLTEEELTKLPEAMAMLDAKIAATAPRDAIDWFGKYVFQTRADAVELATRLVASPRVQMQVGLWLFDTELARYATSAPLVPLYLRALAGDEPTADEWTEAAALARAVTDAARGQSGNIRSAPVMAASAATAPRTDLHAAAQAAMIVAAWLGNEKWPPEETEARMDVNAARFRQRFTDKVVDLLTAAN